MSTWSAPVRFAEVDGQGVVFNAHYLTYCDEAMSAFCSDRGLAGFAAEVMLVTSTLRWTSAARWGDTVDVDVSCSRIGTTSFELAFAVHVGERRCCDVVTSYVHIGADGRPAPVPDAARAALRSVS